jgi:hypothetical protein
MTRLPACAICLALAVWFVAPVPAHASKRVANRTYVQSGPDGASYARCMPTAEEGSAGRTDIYTVGATDDQRVDRYDWYAPGGVTLGWSPLAGKLAVLAVVAERRQDGDWRAQEELRFAIGGKVIRSYTNGELIALGAAEVMSRRLGQRAEYRVVGCEQVPGTNEYDFILEVAGGTKGEGKTLRFDITTGELRPDRPRVPIGAGDQDEAVRVARAFIARTHPKLNIAQRPPSAKYVPDANGKLMWVVTFAAATTAKSDAADQQFYSFDVRLQQDGQVESTTSPEP